MMRNWTLIVGGIYLSCMLHGQIKGVVYGVEHEELTGALILLLPDSINTSTDMEGRFDFNVEPRANHVLQVSYLGYKPQEISLRTENTLYPIVIHMMESEQLLEEVVISEEHAKQENSLSVDHISEQFLDAYGKGTFAKSLERIPGISAINVGVGIAKPVIRGLSSNRIIVNQQGIKQEGQQWGADHGLEVDQFDVERVEVIKGPASLQYGSDGLGGVINIMPGRIVPLNTMKAEVEGVMKSNNDHYGGSAALSLNKNNIFFSGRLSAQSFADYRVPGDQFTYNSYTLPILNERLKNTAGKEFSTKASVGMQKKWGISRMVFSHYSLDAGLFSGAVGVPRSYALTDDGNNRDIDVPSQEVDHYKLSLHHSMGFGEDHLDFNIGFQHNIRKEYSVPEFHSIPSSLLDPGNTLALQFDLRTLSGNIHYEQHLDKRHKLVYGGNLQWQNNDRSGFEFLLPDFNTFRGGGFVLSEWSFNSDLIINAGVRLDYGQNNTKYDRQWVWDSNESIVDSLVVPMVDRSYFNWSTSGGLSFPLLDNQLIWKLNAGKSFRVPYPAEMVSNGIHHGTFRHEIGTPDLVSEHGYQLDLGIGFSFSNLKGSFQTYFNYFKNYIYLGPTFPATFSPLPESGQIFQYRQDDAIYTGLEWNVEWTMNSYFTIIQGADYVHSHNLNTRLALPFTPQPSLKNALRLEIIEKSKTISDFYIEFGHEWYLAARGNNRIDRSEKPTPAYQLWNITSSFDLWISGQQVKFNFRIENIFDTFYLNHLSRYRLINIPEQGRNMILSLKIPISGNM